MTELQKNLPTGWDCRLDEKSGRYYYVNHYTKTTTWDDPRTIRHRTGQKHASNAQTEHIPLQHGSPDLRRNYVYPSQITPIPAFQIPTHMSPKSVPIQDLKPRMSPLNVKPKIQDSSLTITSESDEAVAKISAMFPTVSETHIKMLLKNCRYMKSVFPQADETVILDVLQNNENNIQKTTDCLKEMGFNRKDTVKIAQQTAKLQKEEKQKEKNKVEPSTSTVKTKTPEEKQQVKRNLQEKYKDVAEYLISIALESVNFDETRANDILKIMIQEDTQTNSSKCPEPVAEDSVDHSTSSNPMPVSQSRQSIKSLLKTDKDMDKVTYSRVIDENGSAFKSPYLSNTKGPERLYAKGANDKLLLEDYLKWQGPNCNLTRGSQGLAKGPNSGLLSNRIYQACGSNKELRKGPKFGLAKGSIFSQLKSLPDDSRGQ